MDIQLFIIIVIVAVAALYLARTLYYSAKGHSCASGKCGCEKQMRVK